MLIFSTKEKLIKKIFFAFLIVIFSISAVWAKDSEKKKAQSIVRDNEDNNVIYQGDMFVRGALGFDVPIFAHFYNDKSIGKNGAVLAPKQYGCPVGGNLDLSFLYFFENNWGVGVELAGELLQTKEKYQSIVALGALGGYMFRTWPFDTFLGSGLGLSFNSLYINGGDNLLYISFYFKPELEFFWNINKDWAVGFDTDYWIIPEIYFDNKKNQSSFTHFWSIGFAVRYKI